MNRMSAGKDVLPMETMRLGRTNIQAFRSGFGALPVQRVPMADAVKLLRGAFAGGFNFFDTARAYTDSEEKLGAAFSDVRRQIYIATKSPSTDRAGVLRDIDVSLGKLKTDYVDILQLHNPSALPNPQDPESSYQGLLEARWQGKTRFIGITCHRLDNALAAARSGLYDTVQFPLSSLSSDADLELPAVCREHDIGLIGMKGLSGGLITNAASTFAFLRQYDNVLPIWGIQRERELLEFLEFEKHPPVLDDALRAVIERDRRELTGEFCRGCGYCLPCPADIDIPTAARMSLLLRRSPYQHFIQDDFSQKMQRIENCIHCNHCKEHCPYHLDTPNLLQKMLADYRSFREEHRAEIVR